MPKKLIDLDLLQDFRQKYDTRLKNGTLVPAKAQIAEQIANVSEDVGSTQEEPFIFQGTATDNGLDSVETAPIAKHLEKQGNSVVVNQLLNHANWSGQTITNGITYTNNHDGSISISGTASANADFVIAPNTFVLLANHRYLMYGGKSSNIMCRFSGAPAGVWEDTGNGSIIAPNVDTTAYNYCVRVISGTAISGTIKVVPQLIDLTQWGFTADEITDLTAHPEHFFNYYNGSLAYNTGTLTNSNGRYLKCIGRNQWDEETILSGSNTISSKNHIRVIPNAKYYIKVGSGYGSYINVYYYDANKNYLGQISGSSIPINSVFDIPAGGYYIKFTTLSGSTYNHDITISIYYEDGTDYDQYFPYEENTYDTGTEVLRSAGSVRDVKLPDGSIERKVGTYTFTGNESWSMAGAFAYITFTSSEIPQEWATTGASKCSNGLTMYLSNSRQLRVYYADNPSITSSTNMNTVFPSGTIMNYELATPTTEQGTSFAENVIVDNYGSMGWLDTDSNFVSVPQGSEFFYPADYVEFLDSLYTRSKDGGTSADVTNIVVQSELTPFTNKDTQLQNAIGGTLRNVLSVKATLDFNSTDFVDLGTLTWTLTGTIFWATISDMVVATDNIICSNYKSQGYVNSSSNLQDKCVGTNQWSGAGGKQIIIKDSSYTSADTFKAAMKGVLLAYEKAGS